MNTAVPSVDTLNASTTKWNIDPTHSMTEFSARHMMITTVKGTIPELRGVVTIDENSPENSSVEVELDADSITTRSADRDTHLRSADFLDVDNFPTISFRSTRVDGASMKAGTNFRVVGELSIRGVTREVTLDATFEGSGRDPWGGDRVSFAAQTKIDRREFGLTWNSTLEAGGVLVSNEIRISLEVQAVKSA